MGQSSHKIGTMGSQIGKDRPKLAQERPKPPQNKPGLWNLLTLGLTNGLTFLSPYSGKNLRINRARRNPYLNDVVIAIPPSNFCHNAQIS